MAQPAIKRFEWELEVCLTNLKKHNIKDIVLLFSKYDNFVVKKLRDKYKIETYVFPDNRRSKKYIPSIKPYLWWQFLKNNPSMEKETYFYMDSDVIFREIPDFNKIKFNRNLWVGSDTDSYLSPKYINSKGRNLLYDMCKLIDVDYNKISKLDGKSCGAQWILDNPTADYWEKSYYDCNKLYIYLDSIEKNYVNKNKEGYVPIQKWTAQMWTDLWDAIYFGKEIDISHELDFCWATDNIERWNKVKIYHNAGVIDNTKNLFFKGKYINRDPFKDDLSFVNKGKCSYKYVQAIKEVK